MNKKICLLCSGLFLLGACSGDRVVLLSDPDGHTGKIEVATKAGSQLMDKSMTVTFVSGATSSPEAPEAISNNEVQAVWGKALAMMPPPPEMFTLYFVSGEADLTDASLKELPAILERVKLRPIVHIVVAGHADAVGSDEANIVVSRDRAQKVRDILAAAGAPLSAFEVSSHGKRNQLFKTPDGVSERRNRRVSVTIQ